MAATPEPAQADLERVVEDVVEELRRRLGSSFVLDELADLYGETTDWATELADRRGAGTDSAAVVDAAFARYAREASNYAGVWRARGTEALRRGSGLGAVSPSSAALCSRRLVAGASSPAPASRSAGSHHGQGVGRPCSA